MRKYSKYQIYNKLTLRLKKFPLRILKFKRPKWFKLQKTLTSLQKKDLLPNLFLYKNSYRSWDKVKKYYKNFLQTKRSFLAFQDYKVSKYEKSLFLKKEIILHYFIKPEFRLDTLLWSLYFFESSFEASYRINSGFVFVNGKRAYSTKFLQKGDIITIKCSSNVTKCLSKYSFHKKILSFVEVDYYTNTVIVIKNYNELSEEDICLSACDYLNVNFLTHS